MGIVRERNMQNLDDRQKRQFDQIKKWAKEEHDGKLSYMTLMDMLRYENAPLAEEMEVLNQIVYDLMEDGIEIEALEEGETYPAENPESDQFIPALVKIAQPPLNVSNLMERLEDGEIDLEPVYQRRKEIWDPKRQSQLIESLMLRIPIPSFYFDTAQEGTWKVIDGLQRLTAFKNYLTGEKKKKLQDLQYLTDFDGKTFDELPRQYIRRIKEAPIVAFCVDKGTPEGIIYNIFQRINTGGLKLTPQEIRNAMYHGKSTELAKRLCASEEFLETTMYAVKPDRMTDQEYAIRFMAFTELDYSVEYQDDIDAFLIKAMKKVNDYSEGELKRIESGFCRVMEYCRKIFGKYAFRRIGENGRRGQINKALFELWSVCFSELTEDELRKLEERSKKFMERYACLFQKKDFVQALKSGKRTDCIKRIREGKKLIEELLC